MDGLKERIIWCFWTGDNKMHGSRALAFKTLQEKNNCKLTLVNENTLKDFEIPSDRIHKGYELLSDVHRSDYLRSYFMYHYGGGYADIKPYTFDWNEYFALLEKSDKDFIGARESMPSFIASEEELVRNAYQELVGNCYFIFKKHSFFAFLWKNEVNKKMDEIYPKLLIQNGRYHPRAIKDGAHRALGYFPKNYPLRWAEMQGEIFHRLQYENRTKYLLDLPVQYWIDANKYRSESLLQKLKQFAWKVVKKIT